MSSSHSSPSDPLKNRGSLDESSFQQLKHSNGKAAYPLVVRSLSLTPDFRENLLSCFERSSQEKISEQNSRTTTPSFGADVERVVDEEFSLQNSQGMHDQFQQFTFSSAQLPAAEISSTTGTVDLEGPRGTSGSRTVTMNTNTIAGQRSWDRKLKESSESSMEMSGNLLVTGNLFPQMNIGKDHGFLMDDGESYTSLSVGADGLPIVCNSKGCRPLSESEKQTLMYAITTSRSRGGDHQIHASEQNENHHWDRAACDMGSYYKRSLDAGHNDALLLRNFAQFLYEIRCDFGRAEEYYERAILAASDDGEVLSQYAKLLWEIHGDKERAESYYERAVQAAPEDCYVLGSYASFLWDAEDGGQEENASANDQHLPPYV